MVPRQLTLTRAALALGAVALAAGLAPRGDAVPSRDPGPFFPLKVAHEGQAYADRLPSGPSYALRSGRLPDGLTLAADGRVSGTPQETGVFSATLSASQGSALVPYRVSITVRRPDELDLARTAASFLSEGPHTTRVDTVALDITNTFDGAPVRTLVRVVRPTTLSGPAPLLLFHRGRGFDEDSYKLFHRHIASHGIAVASVEDAYSFAGRTFSATNSTYDMWRADLGMLSASGVVEAVGDYLIDRSDTLGTGFSGSFDSENIFFAGHSRGGGAVHASHQRSRPLRIKGLIYLMAFDLRYFSEVRAPADSPAYAIGDAHVRTPALIIAAENDGDLSYPIADQLIDRATGPTTQVTLYGGVHNLISDSHPSEGDDRITRAEERTRVADWIVCFIKRWADDEGDLDWRLYGGAHQGSQTVGVTAWQPSARTLLLEDAQDGDISRNLVGRNLVGGNVRRRELSIYPSVGDMDSLGLQHTLLIPTEQVSIWRLASDQALDVSEHSRLVLRISQTGRYGWSGTGVWLRVLDAAGTPSWYRVWEPSAGGHLPDYDGLSPHDRFVDVHVELDDLFPGSSGAAPADLSRFAALDLFVVVRDGQRARDVVADMIRFE
jgi:hypothetical protein